jgi:hypothetical protein
VTSYWPLSDIDPAPGNPQGLIGLAADFSRRANTLQHAAGQVASTAASSDGVWVGPASDAFRLTAELATIRFGKARDSFATASASIDAFAGALTTAQHDLRKWADIARSARSSRADAVLLLNATPPEDPARGRLQQLVYNADYELNKARVGFAHALDLLHLAERTCVNQLHAVTAGALRGVLLCGASGSALVSVSGTGVTGSMSVDDAGPSIGIGVDIPSKSKASAKDVTKSGQTTKTAIDAVEVYEVGKKSTRNTTWDRRYGTDPADGKPTKGKPSNNSAKGKKPTVEAKLAETTFWEHESSAGARAEGQNEHGSWSVEAGAVAQTAGSAKATAGKDGVKVAVDVSAKAAVEARATADFKTEYVSGGTTVYAAAKAEANAHAVAGIGKDGAKVGVGADAFVGFEVGNDSHLNVGGVEVGSHTGMTFGVGVKADAGAEVSMKKVGVHAEFGAALGLGFDVSFNVELHPAELAHNAGKILKHIFW